MTVIATPTVRVFTVSREVRKFGSSRGMGARPALGARPLGWAPPLPSGYCAGVMACVWLVAAAGVSPSGGGARRVWSRGAGNDHIDFLNRFDRADLTAQNLTALKIGWPRKPTRTTSAATSATTTAAHHPDHFGTPTILSLPTHTCCQHTPCADSARHVLTPPFSTPACMQTIRLDVCREWKPRTYTMCSPATRPTKRHANPKPGAAALAKPY